MRDFRPIRSDADLTWSLAAIEPYFHCPPTPASEESDRFDILATMIDAYENEHSPIEACDPVDMLHYAIRDLGRSQAELVDLFGSRSRASEILNRKRALTLEQIRLVSEAWHLPVAVLTRPNPLSQDAA